MSNIKDVEDWKKAVAADGTLLGLDEWVQERSKAAHGVFEEPECCEQCQSDAPMTFHMASSITGSVVKNGVPAWICDDCGFAHVQPDHHDDCQGC